LVKILVSKTTGSPPDLGGLVVSRISPLKSKGVRPPNPLPPDPPRADVDLARTQSMHSRYSVETLFFLNSFVLFDYRGLLSFVTLSCF